MKTRRARISSSLGAAAILIAGWWLWLGVLKPDSAPAVRAGHGTPQQPVQTPRSEPAPASGAVAVRTRADSPGGPAPLADALGAFKEWHQRYLAAGPLERVALEGEGRALAQRRRPVFKQLIESDPQKALQEAVPMVVRQQLPPSIVALLEERLADRGVLRSYWRAPDPDDDSPPVIRYAELEGGQTVRAHVYGRRAAQTAWTMDASLNGVAIDGQAAIHESPLRVLEFGEIPDQTKSAIEVCPVSGIVTEAVVSPAPVTAATPAVEAYGEIVYLCDGSHALVYEQTLIMGESSSGGAQSFTGILPSAPTPSVGVVKVLCIPAIFPDQGQVPASEATMLNMLRETGDFYQVTSYGRLTLVATVTPPVTLPRNQAWYKGKDTTDGFVKEIDGLGLEMAHAKEEARKLGYDWQDYHATVVRANGGARAPTSFGGGGNVWMRNDNTSTCSHEVGHAFGLAHANFWQTNGASVIGPGGNVEYGDVYDNMGNGAPPWGHWNVQAKNQVKWLPDEFAPPITANGIYRIHAMDTPRLEPGKRYGLRVRKDQDRTYWGEHRTLFSATNNWAANGLLLGWKWPLNSGSNLQLLDTTPGSPNDRSDAGISLGRTFSDLEAGIHITTLAVNSATTPRSVDVQVNFGQFPGNRAPSLTLTASATVVPVNSPITFTAAATDPDGDDLSYGWIWHDSTITPNAPVVSRTFTTAGIYTLNCVVSDMKGGTAIRNAVITVGNGGSRFAISGRITQDGAGLSGINVSTSGTNGTLTDSDGYYTISNLTAATYTVTPARHGYAFNELFNNSISVGPSFSGADFTVDELPRVNITAPAPVAAEGGSPGTFRLSRTGSTALPLTVYVFPAQGTAAKTTDYTFSPDYVTVTGTPWQTFTIPEDEAFLDITVAAVNDAAQEGFETVTLVLGQDASFAPGSSVEATIGLADDDTPRPRVSLAAAPAQVDENSGQSIVCTVRRTGSTAASLAVTYTVAATSTATAGVDYAALPGTVTIPAGAAEAAFAIAPIDDDIAEVTESVTVTIATNAAFVADASAASITARLVDNDTQMVTVAVPDSAAAEVDLTGAGAVPNPGSILLTRSGDTSAALTVFYSVAGTALHGVDYDALPGSVVFPAGETAVPITIMPRFDAFGEAPETVVLSIAAGYGNYALGETFSGTVTISDSAGPPLLEVMASGLIAAEPSTNGTFRITAKGTGTGTVTVQYTVSGTATPGVDYTIAGLDAGTMAGSTTITLNNGTATRDLTVTVINDALVEPLETITLTLTASPNYQLWSQRASTTMLLRDDEQPTVFVDGQVGTAGNHAVAENSTATTCKFWISRTGSTTSALTVNYTMVGTATNGVDHTNLTGTAIIPAGAPGIDVSFNTINDSLFEGTESVIMRLSPGSYARGPDGQINISDDETGSTTVAFGGTGGSGPESQTAVNIPVRLTAAAPSAATVEYVLEAGARTPSVVFGTWLRVVKTGTNFDTYFSRDGVSFTKISSTRSMAGFPASYLAGMVVTSAASGTAATVEIDQVSVAGLSAGGSADALIGADLAGTAPAGTHSAGGEVYHITAGGPDLGITSSDGGARIVYFPITNSADCTITLRVRTLTSTGTSAKAGAIIRETMASNSRYIASFVMNSATSWAGQTYRLTTGGTAANTVLPVPTFSKPQWLRLERTGNSFATYTSADGINFAPFGALTLPFSSQLLAGLAASSRSDGTLTQATFEQPTLSPPSPEPFQGRPVGYVNEPGNLTQTGESYVITASGSGIMPNLTSTEDECHFAAAPVSGDFTLTARLTSVAGGASNAQAGLMVRETANHRGRAMFFGLTGSGTTAAEFRTRLSGTTTGEGGGVDYHLAGGTLSFEPGQTEQNIVLQVNDDALPEPNETVNVQLRNAAGAVLGFPSNYTYTIVDDDALANLPGVAFSAPASIAENTAAPAMIHVALSRPFEETVSVNYASTTSGTAASGVDFTPVSGTLTFEPGRTLQTIAVPIIDDSLVEPAETVILTLSNPVNAVLTTSASHTLTITDDDAPVVTIVASDPTATEGGDSGAFTISRTGPTTGSLVVLFSRSGTAASGTDFTAFSPSTTITIPAGQSSAELVVSPVQNTSPEIPETVIVTLTGASGYAVGQPSSATVTIHDDDVNTVSLTVSDGVASEAGPDHGAFTLSRTGPTTASLSVNLSVTGTATAGVDYDSFPTTAVFSIGQTSINIPVTVRQDELTEGTEEAVLSINSSSTYLSGDPSVANISITDDDLPPTVFIGSPAGKSTIIAADDGLMLQAVGADDGLPNLLTYSWTQLFGPGTAQFESPSAAATGVKFSAPGVYGLRIAVSDGQFSATDDLFVQCGGFAYAQWVSSDQGPPSVRGVAGESNGVFRLIGSGTGYSTANDSGHMLFRQLIGGTGDCSITARLTGMTGPATRLAGLTIRDTSWKGARRANLLLDGTGTLQFRTRATANTTDASVTDSGFSTPQWLRLERTGGNVSAFSAPDVAGAPGSWTQIGAETPVTMGSNVVIGLVVSAGASTTASATALFDQVAVTPSFSGPALHSEDIGNYTTAGSSSEAGGTFTLNAVGSYDGTGGHFRYQQVWGDCIVTARLLSHSGATRGAQSGVGIRDGVDNGPHGFYGTTTIDGFQAHWRSIPGGTAGTLQTGGSIGSWIRLIRKGNSISAFRAANANGVPGPWAQVTGNLPAAMGGPMLVGLVVDSNSATLTATGSFSGLTIEPLNTAPVVNPGVIADLPPFVLNGTVIDDGKPNPPGAFTLLWSKRAGAGEVSFGDPTALSTVATLSASGPYTFRLAADDGDSRTFDDLTFSGYLTRYARWRDQQFTDGLSNPLAAQDADPDHDGLINLLEYGLGLTGMAANAPPAVHEMVASGPDRFFRATLPKNPNAPDVIWQAEVTSDPSDPQSWTSAGLVIEVNTATTLRVRDTVAATPGVRRFVRFRAALPP